MNSSTTTPRRPGFLRQVFARVFGWTTLAKGLRDGLDAVPTERHFRLARDGSKLGFFEHVIVDIADRNTAGIMKGWRNRKEQLDGALTTLWRLKNELLADDAALRERHRALGLSEPHGDLPTIPYRAIMLAAAAGEMPLNRVAAQIVLLQPYEEIILAALVSLISIAGAHGLGKVLRQWNWNATHPWRRTMTCLIALVLMVVPSAIGFLRHAYLATGTPAAYTSLALWALNVGLVGVAAYASYLAHEPDLRVEQLAFERRRLARRLSRAEARWNALSAKYDAGRAETLERLYGLRADAIARIDEHRQGVAESLHEFPSWFNEAIRESVFRPIDPDLLAKLQPPPSAGMSINFSDTPEVDPNTEVN